ncbi:hypothetical protein QCA50_016458, partial [Cerrena zonata]
MILIPMVFFVFTFKVKMVTLTISEVSFLGNAFFVVTVFPHPTSIPDNRLSG